jgi:hypothetical protein
MMLYLAVTFSFDCGWVGVAVDDRKLKFGKYVYRCVVVRRRIYKIRSDKAAIFCHIMAINRKIPRPATRVTSIGYTDRVFTRFQIERKGEQQTTTRYSAECARTVFNNIFGCDCYYLLYIYCILLFYHPLALRIKSIHMRMIDCSMDSIVSYVDTTTVRSSSIK